MTASFQAFLRRSKDVEASQFALRALDVMEKGASASGDYLAEAWRANMAAGRDPSDAMKMRRAVLAQRAYENRVTSEKGRMMAAFSIMASREGNDAITAQQAALRARTAQERQVLVERAKHATRRRNVMLEAAEVASKSFNAPALPPLVAQGSAFNDGEMTVGLTNEFRPPSLVKRTNLFFPNDVRVAAGAAGGESLKGLAALDAGSWWPSFVAHQSDGILAAFSEAERAASPITGQEPGVVAVTEEAKKVMSALQPAQVSTAKAAQSSVPWGLIAVGAAAAYYFLK